MVVLAPQSSEGKTITRTFDPTGPLLLGTTGVAVDESGNIYVAGQDTDNVLRIDPNGLVTEIIDSAGDGAANTLDAPTHLATGTSWCETSFL